MSIPSPFIPNGEKGSSSSSPNPIIDCITTTTPHEAASVSIASTTGSVVAAAPAPTMTTMMILPVPAPSTLPPRRTKSYNSFRERIVDVSTMGQPPPSSSLPASASVATTEPSSSSLRCASTSDTSCILTTQTSNTQEAATTAATTRSNPEPTERSAVGMEASRQARVRMVQQSATTTTSPVTTATNEGDRAALPSMAAAPTTTTKRRIFQSPRCEIPDEQLFPSSHAAWVIHCAGMHQLGAPYAGQPLPPSHPQHQYRTDRTSTDTYTTTTSIVIPPPMSVPLSSWSEPNERWKLLSQQAGAHQQDGSTLTVRRNITPAALKSGMPVTAADRVRTLYLPIFSCAKSSLVQARQQRRRRRHRQTQHQQQPMNSIDEEEDAVVAATLRSESELLPAWLDVVAETFFQLEHLYLSIEFHPQRQQYYAEASTRSSSMHNEGRHHHHQYRHHHDHATREEKKECGMEMIVNPNESDYLTDPASLLIRTTTSSASTNSDSTCTTTDVPIDDTVAAGGSCDDSQSTNHSCWTAMTSSSTQDPHLSIRLRRLYVLYRLPDLRSIDGIPVTERERMLARPEHPNGQRVPANEWRISTVLPNDSAKRDDNDDDDKANEKGSRSRRLRLRVSSKNNNNAPLVTTARSLSLDDDAVEVDLTGSVKVHHLPRCRPVVVKDRPNEAIAEDAQQQQPQLRPRRPPTLSLAANEPSAAQQLRLQLEQYKLDRLQRNSNHTNVAGIDLSRTIPLIRWQSCRAVQRSAVANKYNQSNRFCTSDSSGHAIMDPIQRGLLPSNSEETSQGVEVPLRTVTSGASHETMSKSPILESTSTSRTLMSSHSYSSSSSSSSSSWPSSPCSRSSTSAGNTTPKTTTTAAAVVMEEVLQELGMDRFDVEVAEVESVGASCEWSATCGTFTSIPLAAAALQRHRRQRRRLQLQQQQPQRISELGLLSLSTLTRSSHTETRTQMTMGHAREGNKNDDDITTDTGVEVSAGENCLLINSRTSHSARRIDHLDGADEAIERSVSPIQLDPSGISPTVIASLSSSSSGEKKENIDGIDSNHLSSTERSFPIVAFDGASQHLPLPLDSMGGSPAFRPVAEYDHELSSAPNLSMVPAISPVIHSASCSVADSPARSAVSNSSECRRIPASQSLTSPFPMQFRVRAAHLSVVTSTASTVRSSAIPPAVMTIQKNSSSPSRRPLMVATHFSSDEEGEEENQTDNKALLQAELLVQYDDSTSLRPTIAPIPTPPPAPKQGEGSTTASVCSGAPNSFVTMETIEPPIELTRARSSPPKLSAVRRKALLSLAELPPPCPSSGGSGNSSGSSAAHHRRRAMTPPPLMMMMTTTQQRQRHRRHRTSPAGNSSNPSAHKMRKGGFFQWKEKVTARSSSIMDNNDDDDDDDDESDDDDDESDNDDDDNDDDESDDDDVDEEEIILNSQQKTSDPIPFE